MLIKRSDLTEAEIKKLDAGYKFSDAERQAIRKRVGEENILSDDDPNQNFFADTGRVLEATGAGISSALSNLGKGTLIAARNMGVLNSVVDKAITDLRAGTENAQVEELKSKAKEQGMDTTTLDEYLNKAKNTKTSLELINDFSANTFDKWSNEANQRIAELQGETSNDFTKAVIGFVPNLSQQAVTIGASLINPVLGTSVATGQAMGSYYNDAKSRGMTDEQANDFSQIMGIVEGATEMIGVDKLIKAGKGAKALAKGGLSSARKELSKEVITSTFGNLLSGSMDNFIQEAITEPIQEGVADWIGGKGNWENIDERMLKAGINGALTSLITGGAHIGVKSAVGVASRIKNGQNVTQQEVNQGLVDTLAEMDNLSKEEKQEVVDKYVTPGIKTAQDVVKNELNQVPTEPSRAVPMQTSENAQQQVQEQEQQVISNQNENALNQNVEPQNLVESAERSGIDAKDEKTRKNLEVIQKFNENRGIKATFDADAFKGHDNVNSFFRTDENGNREIVFNPNTMTDKTIQQLAVHEIYHDMLAGGSAEELTSFVVNKMNQDKEYQDYVKALQDVYEEQDSDIIKEEAVAHYLEKNLGTNEFISELQQRGDRTTIQKIIDTIKDMITKAKNTLTGKGDLNYLLDLQRKYEQAYRGEFKGTQEQTKLSKQVNAQDNQGKTLTEEQPINKITDDNKLKMTYVRMNNQDTQNYGDTYGQNIEPSGEYMSMDTMQGKYKVPGAEYGTITFENPLVLEHKNTTANGWKKDLSERYNNLTGKKLSNAIMKDGYDAIVTQDEKGNVIEVVNLNGNKETNNNNTKYSVNTSNQPTTDNKGRTLTKEQQDYFKDSKVRDEDGNLLEVYHGTNGQFNQYRINRFGKTDSGMYGKGFYFTDEYNQAKYYGNKVKKQYLDIKNPLYIGKGTKYEDSSDFVRDMRGEKFDRATLWEQAKNGTYKVISAEETTEMAKSKGYDGIIVHPISGAETEYIAFDSNQIKNVDNTNPTESPDIRYSKEAPTRDEQNYNNITFDRFKKYYKDGIDKDLIKTHFEDIKNRVADQYETSVLDVSKEELDRIYNEESPDTIGADFYDYRDMRDAINNGFDNLYDNWIKDEIESFNKNVEYYDKKYEKQRIQAEKDRIANEKLQKEMEESTPFKRNQYKAVTKHNPMWDDYHTGIRSPADIVTFEEAIQNAEKDGVFGWGDYSLEDAKRDLKRNKVTIYSSYPIKRGTFVATSYQQALDYAGGDRSKVHSRTVNPDKIAWINGDEGEYAGTLSKTKDMDTEMLSLERNLESQDIINNFLENTKVNEGTGTAIKDLARVPIQQETQVKTKTKETPVPQETTQNNTKNNEILKTARQLLDKQYALQLSDEMANLSETELKSGLQDLYKSQLDEQLYNAIKDDTKSKRTYMKYKDKDTNYVKSVVEDALYSEKPNRNGKLTVKQWLNIANQIGINASDLTTQQIQDLAYGSWFDLKPTKRITQYDNKIHQAVPFEALTADKWVNAIYNKAKDLKIQDFNQLLNEVQEPIKSNITETTEPAKQVTTQDYLTHHPDYYDGDQFDFNAHRTEVINKANQDIIDIIKNSSNLREDLQRAYDLNEKNDVVDIKTGKDEDNRLTYQHKETILSSLLRSKDIENSDLYKSLMEDTTPRQVAPSEAPAQVPQVNEVKQRQVEPIRDITDVERPQVPQGNKVRQSYISMINSDIQTEEAKQISRELMGYDTIVPQTNAFTLAVADRNIEKNGTNETLTTLTTKANNNDSPTAVDIAMGERLIQYYSKIGDRAKLQEAIQTTAMLGTEAGRAVQAMAMISRQTPTGQVTWIQRSVDKVNKRLAKEGKPQFNFTPEMQQKILNSTQENLQKNLDSVYRELGQQVPKSAMEKFNEWRYFSMLANPKTHIRNILGNVVMAQVQRAKNKIAGTIEDFVIGDNAERWNSLKGASKGMYEFAKNDLKNADVQSMLGLNENKYNPQSRLQQNQRTFKSDLLENTLGKLFELNSKALEVEDGWGLKSGYAKAMANYLNANNLDYNNLTDTQLQKARQYAVEQAKEATFHQDNSIANMLQTIENKNLFTKIAVGGAIPFKKTPMNVALTGFEYSPAGFAKTLTTDLANLRKGKISANQFIDNISKNLTGTAISLLGYGLTQAGILKASGSGDEDKDEFEEATGKQNYSIQIGDKTYSLDWLTPAGIPLFIGSELYQVSHQKEDGNKTKNENEAFKSITKILDATASAMNPMSEMTMISGLTNALKSYAQGSTKSIENMLANVGKSYVTQAVPTALGQIARSTDQYERSTTSTETDPMAKAIDSAKNQIISKIPGLRETLPVSTDVWGNARETQTYEENAILPWTKKEISQDPVNKALTDLYDATGEGGVLPDNYIDKTLTIDKEKYKLTNEEYAELKQQYGKTSHDILSNLTNTSNYNKMTDEQKVKAVKEAYSYAKSTLKVKYSQDNDLDAEESATYKKVQNVINNGGDAREYFEYVGLTSGLDKDKEKMKALQNSNIKNKGAIYESTIGKNDETYQIMKNAGINANAYLDYKQQEFKTDKENDYSAKNQFYDYMDDANMTYEQKLLLTGMKYKLNPGERDTLADYIENLPISAQEKTDMFSKLKGCKINEYGEIYY